MNTLSICQIDRVWKSSSHETHMLSLVFVLEILRCAVSRGPVSPGGQDNVQPWRKLLVPQSFAVAFQIFKVSEA
jgi:hypothetical protein